MLLMLVACTKVQAPAFHGAEPFLFATKDGVLLSWLEPVANTDRTALRFARHANGEWSAARTIVERNDLFVNWADFPSIVEDARGVLFAHWLQKSSSGKYSYDVMMASSRDGGASWSKPFLLNRDGKASEHGFVSLVPRADDGIAAVWLDGRNMPPGDMTIRYANITADGTLSGETELDARTCECCTTGMTMTASGPVIVYRDRSPREVRDVYFARLDQQPRPLRNDNWTIHGCPVNGPQIDAIGDHVATAWFTGANGQSRVYAAFSNDGGKSFGDAMQVDDGKPLGRVDMVMLDEKSAVVTWLEQTANGAEIRARRVPGGASMKIADTAAARSSGFPRMARAGDAIWFAWTAGKEIRLARHSF